MSGKTASRRWTITASSDPWKWGVEWAHDGLPQRCPTRTDACGRGKVFRDYNQRIIANSDQFYSYRVPTDFRIEEREVRVFSTREVPDPKLEEKCGGTHSDF